MDVTLLGTGCPIPTLERAGTSLAIEIDGSPLLVDCGPGTVYRLVEHGIHPADVESLFFTHHHFDHDASFFHFVLAGWSLGRERLRLYGPEHTGDLLDALYDLYESDIAYRKQFDYPDGGIEDITWVRTGEGVVAETERWVVRATPVDHSIETYAYRFEETATDRSVVFSADTRKMDELAEFATDADVLIQDCCVAPAAESPPSGRGLVWDDRIGDLSEEARAKLRRTHCTPEDAGEIAAAADVDTVVATHLLPYRDVAAIRDRIASVFRGEVIVAEDGLSLTL